MKYEIKNIAWINCIFVSMDTTSTTIQIWVKASSVYETRKENGISHFLEHMFFKWWKKYKTAQEVTETIDNIWWEFNAFTWREGTGYYVKVAPDYIDLAVDLLSDMLVNPTFDPNEIEKEKWVIVQELKMNQDNPHKVLITKFLEFYHGDNPYGWPVIGTEENILSFTQKDLFNYKNSLYTKDNLVIAIAWKIDNQRKIEKLIEEKFDNLPEKKIKQKAEYLGIQTKEKQWFFEKKVEQSHIILWIPWVNIFDDRKYDLSLLATILWWNMSSVLFQELREKLGLCYYIWASSYTNDEDGLFMIRAGLDKKNFKKWVEKINEVLDEIVDWNITQEQLEKAKGYLIWKTEIWIETSDEMVNYVLDQYLSKKEIVNLEEFVEKIKEISLQDVKQVAKLLEKENRYLYYLE